MTVNRITHDNFSTPAQANVGGHPTDVQGRIDVQGRMLQIYQNSLPINPSYLPQFAPGSKRALKKAEFFPQQPMQHQQGDGLSSESRKRKTVLCATRLTNPGQSGSKQPVAFQDRIPSASATKRPKTLSSLHTEGAGSSSEGTRSLPISELSSAFWPQTTEEEPPIKQEDLVPLIKLESLPFTPISFTASTSLLDTDFFQGVPAQIPPPDQGFESTLVSFRKSFSWPDTEPGTDFFQESPLETSTSNDIPPPDQGFIRPYEPTLASFEPTLASFREPFSWPDTEPGTDFFQESPIQISTSNGIQPPPAPPGQNFAPTSVSFSEPISLYRQKQCNNWTSVQDKALQKKVDEARAQGTLVNAICKELSEQDEMFKNRTPRIIERRYKLLNQRKCKANKKKKPFPLHQIFIQQYEPTLAVQAFPNADKIKNPWTPDQEKSLVEKVDKARAQGTTVNAICERLRKKDKMFKDRTLGALKKRYYNNTSERIITLPKDV